MLPVGVFTIRNWQTSDRLVQELNIGAVTLPMLKLLSSKHKNATILIKHSNWYSFARVSTVF